MSTIVIAGGHGKIALRLARERKHRGRKGGHEPWAGAHDSHHASVDMKILPRTKRVQVRTEVRVLHWPATKFPLFWEMG